jgi:predicted nucleotidyltransferase
MLAVLKECKNAFAGKYGILAMGIYGSVARDAFGADSDLDVYVRTITPNPFALIHMKEEIEEKVHRRVDIVRLREGMNPFLRKRIEKEGICV